MQQWRSPPTTNPNADVLMFLYRPEYYLPSEKAAEQDLVGACEVVIAKQRNGPRTTVPLNFEEHYTRFETHQRQYLAAA